MRRVTIAVIGNGKTTRANVEALISDVVESGDEVNLALVFSDKPSEGLLWSYQYALSKGLEVLAFTYEGVTAPTLDKVSISHSDDPYESLVKNTEELRLFVLWDDEDVSCQDAMSIAQKHKLPIFDLTNGLVKIKVPKEPVAKTQKVEMPQLELDLPKKKEEVEEEDEDDEEYEDDEYSEVTDVILEAIEQTARVFAQVVAKELMAALKDLEKGKPDETK